MSIDSLTNRGEYLSAYFLSEVLPATLKGGLFKTWAAAEKAGRTTPRVGLRRLRRPYLDARAELTEDPRSYDLKLLRELHQEILSALGFADGAQRITVERAGREHEIPVAHAEQHTSHGIVAIECGWAFDTDAAHDTSEDGAGLLLDPIEIDGGATITTGAKLAAWLFAAEQPPRYVLILNGGVLTLADRHTWGEGRYLAVSLDDAYARNDDHELGIIAALFGADSLRPPAEGGAEPLANLLAESRQRSAGVDKELREGLRDSVELIANEVLDRIRAAGFAPEQVREPAELARLLARESLRYLYRILFLLYAEARPELGVLPVNDPEYLDGYSVARLGELVARPLPPSAEDGFHLYESLDLLFRMVNQGHRPRGGQRVGETDSEREGLRFEPLRSDLFLDGAITLIGRSEPRPDADPDDPHAPTLDTRLRNRTLHTVLKKLMLTKGSRKGRGGFISYAALGVNQLGAVYEGLMSYSGFIAVEELYEVAKNGDPKDGSWMVPASKTGEYDDAVFVLREDPVTGVRKRVSYAPGQFVYRLAGRDRQTSASYYTPQSLTEVTVQLALRYRLDQDGTTTPARELLDWTICEPALGSGSFLNEAINQVADEYLRRRQRERGVDLDPEERHQELQRVKAYIALHNCYGVDLNRTAVELAEVSLWLNVMHRGLQAPWFGLHLRRGNSLIGARRQVYTPEQLADKSWLKTAPQDCHLRDGAIPDGTIHHFLLPADGWGAVAGEKEARELAPEDAGRLRKWRGAIRRVPSTKRTRKRPSQVERLQALAGRVELLWDLVRQRLAISEREIRRQIPVWGADDLPEVPTDPVPREQILKDLEAPGTPYWRLKTLMDTWCALWFWPLDKADLLDGSAPRYPAKPVEVSHVREAPEYEAPQEYEQPTLTGDEVPAQPSLPLRRAGSRTVTVSEHLDRPVPLANLDDWLTFAEALVGSHDIEEDSLVPEFSRLSDLSVYEEQLPGWMGMSSPQRLSDRFPWLDTAETIAGDQGFFHWELTFANAFARGGFDLQVGNPPWVRPRWQEDMVLAEHDPWFALAEDLSGMESQRRRRTLISDVADQHLQELARSLSALAFLTSRATYYLLSGTQPDLYRAFMCRAWANLSSSGVAGLIHPGSHFGGVREGRLRGASYKHLRFHAHFQNMRRLFPEVDWNKQFGIHVYGRPMSKIHFRHVSWLYATETLVESIYHDGTGEVPGTKHQGTWDLRPHAGRLVEVDDDVLSQWNLLVGDSEIPDYQAKLLYPVTAAEQGAITALANVSQRLADWRPWVSSGFHEGVARANGLIEWKSSDPQQWSEIILQGPHIDVATPLSKQPNIPCKSNKDYEPWVLTLAPDDAIPRTNYRRATDRTAYEEGQDLWGGRRYTEYYRVVWREMISLTTERSLFACLAPPGPAHVGTIRSMALYDNTDTALNAGFWASIPLDYLLRTTGRAHLKVSDAMAMPAPRKGHPLASALLLRILRLNCLTSAYGPLWEELFDERWPREHDWVIQWEKLPEARELGGVRLPWSRDIPLRTERARRAALVEIDALVAVWLNIGIAELLSMYRSRFAVLANYESAMWFDSTGRRITRDYYAHGVGQSNDAYALLEAYLEDEGRNPVPVGYTPPFYKADREAEYRQAHAVFSKRLRAAGGEPS